MNRFGQEQMKRQKLTPLGWEVAADYFREWAKKFGTSELRVPAVVQLQTDDDAVAPALTSFADLMECLDIVAEKSQMPQGTSRLESSQYKPWPVKPQFNVSIPGLEPGAEANSSPLLHVKPVEPVSFYPRI